MYICVFTEILFKNISWKLLIRGLLIKCFISRRMKMLMPPNVYYTHLSRDLYVRQSFLWCKLVCTRTKEKKTDDFAGICIFFYHVHCCILEKVQENVCRDIPILCVFNPLDFLWLHVYQFNCTHKIQRIVLYNLVC